MMYLQTRVTLKAFPVATPRGRSSSSHEGESHFGGKIQVFCKGSPGKIRISGAKHHVFGGMNCVPIDIVPKQCPLLPTT